MYLMAHVCTNCVLFVLFIWSNYCFLFTSVQALASYVTSKLSDSNITLIGVATEDELVSVIQSKDDENEFCGTSDKVGQ